MRERVKFFIEFTCLKSFVIFILFIFCRIVFKFLFYFPSLNSYFVTIKRHSVIFGVLLLQINFKMIKKCLVDNSHTRRIKIYDNLGDGNQALNIHADFMLYNYLFIITYEIYYWELIILWIFFQSIVLFYVLLFEFGLTS